MITTTDFKAVSVVGATIQTFSDHILARRWAKANAARYPGVRIVSTTTTVIERTVYTPKVPVETKLAVAA